MTMENKFPRTALNCRNLSCNNTMRTGEIYIDGFCGRCHRVKEANKNLENLPKAKIGKIELGETPYYFNEIIHSGSIGGRRMNKTMEALQKVDIAIRQKDNFPILYVTKEQQAVVISLEEYKRLKGLEKGTKVIKSMKMDYMTLTPKGMEIVVECEVGVDNNEKRPKE